MLFQPKNEGLIGIPRLSSLDLNNASNDMDDTPLDRLKPLPVEADQALLRQMVQLMSWLKWITLSMAVMLAWLVMGLAFKPGV